MSNLGRGVNWSAYQSIANMFLEGGKAKAAGYEGFGQGLSRGIQQIGAKREQLRQEARQDKLLKEERARQDQIRSEDKAERETARKRQAGLDMAEIVRKMAEAKARGNREQFETNMGMLTNTGNALQRSLAMTERDIAGLGDLAFADPGEVEGLNSKRQRLLEQIANNDQQIAGLYEQRMRTQAQDMTLQLPGLGTLDASGAGFNFRNMGIPGPIRGASVGPNGVSLDVGPAIGGNAPPQQGSTQIQQPEDVQPQMQDQAQVGQAMPQAGGGMELPPPSVFMQDKYAMPNIQTAEQLGSVDTFDAVRALLRNPQDRVALSMSLMGYRPDQGLMDGLSMAMDDIRKNAKEFVGAPAAEKLSDTQRQGVEILDKIAQAPKDIDKAIDKETERLRALEAVVQKYGRQSDANRLRTQQVNDKLTALTIMRDASITEMGKLEPLIRQKISSAQDNIIREDIAEKTAKMDAVDQRIRGMAVAQDDVNMVKDQVLKGLMTPEQAVNYLETKAGGAQQAWRSTTERIRNVAGNIDRSEPITNFENAVRSGDKDDVMTEISKMNDFERAYVVYRDGEGREQMVRHLVYKAGGDPRYDAREGEEALSIPAEQRAAYGNELGRRISRYGQQTIARLKAAESVLESLRSKDERIENSTGWDDVRRKIYQSFGLAINVDQNGNATVSLASNYGMGWTRPAGERLRKMSEYDTSVSSWSPFGIDYRGIQKAALERSRKLEKK